MKKFFIIIFLLILGVGTYVGITKGIDFTEREQTVKTDKIENIGHTDTDPEDISQEENIQEPDSVSKTNEMQETESDKPGFQITEWAVWMQGDVGWSLLDEEWEAEEYSYYASYTLDHVFEEGYDFFYVFEPDSEKITRKEAQMIEDIQVSII